MEINQAQPSWDKSEDQHKDHDRTNTEDQAGGSQVIDLEMQEAFNSIYRSLDED